MAANYTTLSGMSEIRTQSSVNDTPFPKDDEIPEQIVDNICHEIQGVCREISKQVDREPRPVNAETNMEKTVVVPELTVLLEKKINIINQLTAHVKDTKPFDYPRFRGEATMSIPVMMARETSSCQRTVELQSRINAENEQYLKSLEESKQFCDEMETVHDDTDVTSELFSQISAEVNKEFIQCSKLMETIVDSLFPDSCYMDVIGAMFQKLRSKQKEDEWYEVVDKSELSIILSLMQHHLVVMNPDNNFQVKLNM